MNVSGGEMSSGKARTLVRQAAPTLVGMLLVVVALTWWLASDGPRDGAGGSHANAPSSGADRVMVLRPSTSRPVHSPSEPALAPEPAVTPLELPAPLPHSGEAPRLVRVLDEAGQPLPEAVIWPVPRGSVSGIAHVDELGEYTWPEDSPAVPRLHVSAAGYELLGVQRDGESWRLAAACEPSGDDDATWQGELLAYSRGGDAWPAVLVLHLSRVASVRLSMVSDVHPEGWPGELASLQVRGPQEVLVTRWPSAVARELGMIDMQPIPGGWLTFPDGEREAVYRAYGGLVEGEVLLSGLLPDISFTVEGLGVHGETEAGATLVLSRGEWRDLRLRVEHGQHVIAGIVVDEAGEPLEDAQVHWVPPEGRVFPGAAQWTGADGRFRWEAVNADVVDIEVKRSFLIKLQTNLATSDASELVITLASAPRGHFVRFVERGTGRAVSVILAQVIPNLHMGYSGEQTESGAWWFALPTGGALEVRAHLFGGELVSAPVSSGEMTTVEVPRGGSLRVRWPESVGSAAKRRLLLSYQGASSPDWDWRFKQHPEATSWTFDHLLPQLYTVDLQLPLVQEGPESEERESRAAREPPPRALSAWRTVARGEVLVEVGGEHVLDLKPTP